MLKVILNSSSCQVTYFLAICRTQPSSIWASCDFFERPDSLNCCGKAIPFESCCGPSFNLSKRCLTFASSWACSASFTPSLACRWAASEGEGETKLDATQSEPYLFAYFSFILNFERRGDVQWIEKLPRYKQLLEFVRRKLQPFSPRWHFFRTEFEPLTFWSIIALVSPWTTEPPVEFEPYERN